MSKNNWPQINILGNLKHNMHCTPLTKYRNQYKLLSTLNQLGVLPGRIMVPPGPEA